MLATLLWTDSPKGPPRCLRNQKKRRKTGNMRHLSAPNTPLGAGAQGAVVQGGGGSLKPFFVLSLSWNISVKLSRFFSRPEHLVLVGIWFVLYSPPLPPHRPQHSRLCDCARFARGYIHIRNSIVVFIFLCVFCVFMRFWSCSKNPVCFFWGQKAPVFEWNTKKPTKCTPS